MAAIRLRGIIAINRKTLNLIKQIILIESVTFLLIIIIFILYINNIYYFFVIWKIACTPLIWISYIIDFFVLKKIEIMS